MKKSLREAAKKEEVRPISNGNEPENEGIEDIKSIITDYSGKSEAELMHELLRLTAKQKAEGSFDEEAIKAGIESITPLLDQEQRRKLFEITSRL